MKILTVIENFNPVIDGGAELTLESYIKYISSTFPAEYRVLTGRHTRTKDIEKFSFVKRDLHGVDNNKRTLIQELVCIIINVLTLYKRIITFRPNIIEFVPNNYSLYPLIYAALLIRYPILISVHNSSFTDDVVSKGGWLSFLKQQIIIHINSSSRTVVITVSDFIKNGLVRMGFNSERIAVLNNPIEKMFSPSKKGTYAVFASRLVPEKGVKYVLKAFSQVKDLDLRIYGDGPLRNLVEKYAHDNKNIHYYGKVREKDIVLAIRNSFCIIAHPIFDEAYGRFIVHSFSTLKPLISSRSGAIPEQIKHLYNGMLHKKRDVRGMVNCIEMLLNEKNVYARIETNLFKDRVKYSIATLAEKRLDILSKKI